MHTVKWFQLLLFNISNSLYQVFLWNIDNLHRAEWFQKTIILSKWLNNSIWSIDATLTGTTTLGQSGPESSDNERVLHIL